MGAGFGTKTVSRVVALCIEGRYQKRVHKIQIVVIHSRDSSRRLPRSLPQRRWPPPIQPATCKQGVCNRPNQRSGVAWLSSSQQYDACACHREESEIWMPVCAVFPALSFHRRSVRLEKWDTKKGVIDQSIGTDRSIASTKVFADFGPSVRFFLWCPRVLLNDYFPCNAPAFPNNLPIICSCRWAPSEEAAS